MGELRVRLDMTTHTRLDAEAERRTVKPAELAGELLREALCRQVGPVDEGPGQPATQMEQEAANEAT